MQSVLWDRVKQLLGSRLIHRDISLSEWHKHAGSQFPAPGDCRKISGGMQIVIGNPAASGSVPVWEIEHELTPLEEELIRLLLKEHAMEIPDPSSEMESWSRQLGEWISRTASVHDWQAELPRSLGLREQLKDARIPFLLVYGHENDNLPSFADFRQAFLEFLHEDTLLVPLQEREWLILVSDQILAEMETWKEDSEENAEIRKVLYALADGLHQMVTGEWGGECHVAVGEPFFPEERLVKTAVVLKETIELGCQFHKETHVHVPWLVHLERLLGGIPEAVKVRFIEGIAVPLEVFDDPETTATLEAFFQMDGKIGETAKKLYVHRNTLLYRLDKFKLETGLDVRSFSDAVMVRILMLLYKSTKMA